MTARQSTRIADVALPSPGALFGEKYVVEAMLGGGGAGVVFSATHRELRQKVAIKVLRDAGPSVLSERMIREARAALALQSEHVVRVMDVGRDAGRVFIVMEHLEGKDLASHLKERGRFPFVEAVDFVLQACAGVAEAHARGIIHRDLKPSNLFLTERADGTPLVKVLDFGISKTTDADTDQIDCSLTGPAEVLGSPMYMSPEQIRHASDVDHRTDIWSLGVVLFRFVTGLAPFDNKGGGVSGMLAAVVSDPPRPMAAVVPEVPHELEAIIMRCLAKAPYERWGSIASLAAALAPFGSDDGRAAVVRLVRSKADTSGPVPITRPPPSAPPSRAGRGWVYAAGAALLVGTGATAVGLGAFHASAPAAAATSARTAQPASTSPDPSAQLAASASAAPAASAAPPTTSSPTAKPTAPATHATPRPRPPPSPPATNTARAAATNDRY